ncbi:MAG: carboxypeptidase-like regulatory domain-containing protein [Actinomycetota bacterium]
MTLRTRMFLALSIVALVSQSLASPIAQAAIDPTCGVQAASAVTGTIRDSLGSPLAGITVELRQSNSATVVASTSSGSNGSYALCVNPDTYDVRATDNARSLFATADKSVTTFTEPQASIDFALQYKLNQTIDPQAISVPIASSSRNVSWIIRSKAPASTLIQLTLDHLGSSAINVAYTGTEFGGPLNGGWNLWTYSAVITHSLSEGSYWATVFGLDPSTHDQITELGRDPYLVDNQPPRFGPQNPPAVTQCDGNPGASAFSPTQTTNPLALISLGVCDPYSNGGSSSLDPYSVSVQVWDPNNNPVTSGSVFLNQLTIQYMPSVGFQLGTYTFRFSIADNAGNQATSGLYYLTVANQGGAPPVISGPQPGNLGQGANEGIVVGSQFTTPSSLPVVAFLAKDADGQGDLAIGTLHVRIYGPDGATLLYDYDPRQPCDPPTVSCGPNSGLFDPSDGRFQAYGFSLEGKPPGLYVASASIEDHGGNTGSLTWRWVLGAAE